MKIHCLRPQLAILLAFSSVTVLAQTTQSTAQRKEVLQKGRDAYYSLRALGFAGCQSTVSPNWEQVLKNQNVSDPGQVQAALKLLNGLHFTMLMDGNGKVSVQHRSDSEPPNEQVRKGFEDIYSGIDQTVSGFFATWSLFMVTPPFPDTDSEYQLEDLGSQYRLSYKDGSTDVVTLMGKDLIISQIKVTSPEFTSIVKPQMVQTGKGLVLNGYVGDYTPKSGPGVVHLNVKIEHHEISGLQLPTSLIADTSLDGVPTHMELAFSGYEVKNH